MKMRLKRIYARGIARDLAAILSAGAMSLSLILAPVPAAAESPSDILIIANSSLKASSISKAEAREIFLKTRNSLKGKKTTPVHAKMGSALRKAFAKKVLGLSPDDERQYWEKQKIMSGKTPPAEFSNTTRAVFKLRNSISYVYRKDYKDVTKVLLVVPN